ncbi:MAG: D-alanyl-D-alanine carboxypeptidase [Coriobacteriia bacterium]|nr:D-alanyl-D-alanine carboxypeptidase [Coriobacteriia bacterium]
MMAPQKKSSPKKGTHKNPPRSPQVRQEKTWVIVARWIIIALVVLALGGGLFVGAASRAFSLPNERAATESTTSEVAVSTAHYRLTPQTFLPETDLIAGRPVSDYEGLTDDLPNIDAGYAGLYTADGQALFERKVDKKTPMASTTKLMTALIALETTTLDTEMTVSQKAGYMEGTGSGILPNMVLTLSDLLYCMLLPSGNDAAVCIAENISESEEDFTALMNKKAADLGMTSTHYGDATGWSDDNNYTTIEDYSKLTCEVMKNATFREIVATREKNIKVDNTTLELESTNKMYDYLDAVEIVGIKTGHTYGAGYCFIGGAKLNGVELYSIVFDCNDREGSFEDSATLLSWGLGHFETVELVNPTQELGMLFPAGLSNTSVVLSVPEAIQVSNFDFNGPFKYVIDLDDVRGAVEEGQVCGSITWLQDGRTVVTSDLIAGQSIVGSSARSSSDGFWAGVSNGFQILLNTVGIAQETNSSSTLQSHREGRKAA